MLVEETTAKFRSLHTNWNDAVTQEAISLLNLSPNILTTYITYSSLATLAQV